MQNLKIFGLFSILTLGCAVDVDDASTFGNADASGGTGNADGSTTGDDGTDTNPTSAEETGDEETGQGALCGDGIVSGSEECDCGGDSCTDEELGGLGCDGYESPTGSSFNGGTLGCNPASCRHVFSECTYCGDGQINGPEDCEEEVTADCADIGAGAGGDLACNSSCMYDTSACTDCFMQVIPDSDECPGGFTTGNFQGSSLSSWVCGDPTAHASGPGAGQTGMWATNLSGEHNNSESSWLVTPTLNLEGCEGENATLVTVDHWHNFEGGITNADGGIVQVSTNGGQSWAKITPSDGDLYYDSKVLATTISPPDGQTGFSGLNDNQTWKSSVFDLSPYQGASDLRLRFVFGSDSSNARGGWYIDAITVQGGR